jgi:hypothetical protein
LAEKNVVRACYDYAYEQSKGLKVSVSGGGGPEVKKPGRCRITLDYQIGIEPPGSHMFEMMMPPMDPVDPKKTMEK